MHFIISYLSSKLFSLQLVEFRCLHDVPSEPLQPQALTKKGERRLRVLTESTEHQKSISIISRLGETAYFGCHMSSVTRLPARISAMQSRSVADHIKTAGGNHERDTFVRLVRLSRCADWEVSRLKSVLC